MMFSWRKYQQAGVAGTRPDMRRVLGIGAVIALAGSLFATALLAVGCSDATTTTTVAPTTTSTVSVDGADLLPLLEPQDVEAVTGKSEVNRAGRNPERRLGGDLNFVFDSGRPLLMVVVESAASYEAWKADPESFREEVQGVGDAAFIGPAVERSEEPYLLVFRAGDRTIGLFTYDDETAEGWTNLITMEELQELARIIIGRL